jgi:putative zinc finger/helix-turn-helix YgiT family protein
MSEEKYCPACDAYRSFTETPKKETYPVRGVPISVEITVGRCASCGEELFDENRDGALIEKVYSEYRAQAGLLSPQEIVNVREQYGLSQQAFALLLGMSQATINRYEQGGLQDSAHDQMIRACLTSSVMLDLIERRGHLLTGRQLEKARQALTTRQVFEDQPSNTLWCIRWSREVSDKTGFKCFSYERYAAVVVWFCHRFGKVCKTKLNKLLFYADFLYFNEMSQSLTGSPYRKLQYGPAPAHYQALSERLEEDEYTKIEEVAYSGGYQGEDFLVGSSAPDPAAILDRTALSVLEAVARELGPLTAKQISDRSHQERAWTETPDKCLIPYPLAEFLSISFAA